MPPRKIDDALSGSGPIKRKFTGMPAAATSSGPGESSCLRAKPLVQKLRRILVLMTSVFVPFALFAASAAEVPVDIHEAVRSGNVEKIETALKSGEDVNSPDNWGRTPLIVALQQRQAPVVEMLIDRGASVATTDAWGRTPLLVATQLKNTAAIRLLLEKKSDVNAANKNDITPLIAAAQTGNQEAATLLLGAGAAPDSADNLGWTALMWAAYRKDDAIVKLLLANGADPAKTGKRPVYGHRAGKKPRRRCRAHRAARNQNAACNARQNRCGRPPDRNR